MISKYWLNYNSLSRTELVNESELQKVYIKRTPVLFTISL